MPDETSVPNAAATGVRWYIEQNNALLRRLRLPAEMPALPPHMANLMLAPIILTLLDRIDGLEKRIGELEFHATTGRAQSAPTVKRRARR
jgi:hypothetical protein